MSELPEGWEIAKLPDVCQLNPGKPDASRIGPDTQVTFVPMAAVDADLGQITNPTVRPYAEVSKGFTAFQENDVIMAKITPCMENGKAAIARGLSNGIGFGSTEFHVFRHSKGILEEYLFYFIRQDSFRKSAEANMTGSVGQKRVPVDFLKETILPIPPLNEQRRIVAKLEKLLSRVDAAQARLVTIPRIIKRFRQSVLAAACSGRLTADWREENTNIEPASVVLLKLIDNHNKAGGHKQGNAATPTEDVHDLQKEELPEGWEVVELRDLCEPSKPITYGILKPGPDIPDGVPYIRVADFPNDKINLNNIKHTTTEIDSQYARSRLSAGDILLSIRGTVGRVCIVPKELRGANITQDSARLSIQKLVSAEYVALALRAMPTQLRMQKAIKGMAIRGINIGDVRVLQIPLPPLPEQQEIVRRVEALFKTADVLETRYRKAKAHVDKLTQSILARAFRGELVTTEAELARQEGRDYEPASVLLERIWQERAQQPASPKRKMKQPRAAHKKAAASTKLFA